MKLEIRTIAIVNVNAQGADGAAVGVGQVRRSDVRGRVLREGCVILASQSGDGRRADLLLSPDEAVQLGTQLIASAAFAAAAPPPMFNAAEAEAAESSPLIIHGGGRA